MDRCRQDREAFGVPCHGLSCCRQRECHNHSVSQSTRHKIKSSTATVTVWHTTKSKALETGSKPLELLITKLWRTRGMISHYMSCQWESEQLPTCQPTTPTHYMLSPHIVDSELVVESEVIKQLPHIVDSQHVLPTTRQLPVQTIQTEKGQSLSKQI